MNDEAVRQVADEIVRRLTDDLSSADQLSEIGLEIAAAHGLTEDETAAAFDQALAHLKLVRLRVMHVSDQQQAADERRLDEHGG
ncbi:MAG: hypothetical protein JOZ39_06335 [Chloroflexi bacterium]|nr:hypothetical protein [Chloroflexota bacterium]